MAAGEDEYEVLYMGPGAEAAELYQRNLQRKANDNYNVERGILYYHQKGSSDWKQVQRTFEDKQPCKH